MDNKIVEINFFFSFYFLYILINYFYYFNDYINYD